LKLAVFAGDSVIGGVIVIVMFIAVLSAKQNRRKTTNCANTTHKIRVITELPNQSSRADLPHV